MNEWLLIVIIFFGQQGSPPIAGVKLTTDRYFSTESECKQFIEKWEVTSNLPLLTAGAACEKRRGT